MIARKSKSLRKVFVKTPGGKSVLHYKSKTGKNPRCGVTGQILHGISKMRPFGARKIAKSEKSVSRMFGGMLSSRASRREIIGRARSKFE